MKIGNKISLVYSLLTVSVVLAMALVFYLCSRRYAEELYYNFLEEKARVLAMERYGADDMDPAKYSQVVQQRQNALPTLDQLLVDMADLDSARLLLSPYLDSAQFRLLLGGKVVNFRHAGEVGSALLYYDNQGTFASLVVSRNPYGESMAGAVGTGLALMVLLAAILLWLISRLWASRMVNRIDADYQAEKLFVNNVQHEIGNPLAAIRGECEVTLLRERPPGEYRSSLLRIEEEADRISTTMARLLSLSDHSLRDTSSPEPRPAPLSTLVAPYRSADVRLQVERDFATTLDPELLGIVVRNLLSNARKYGDGTPVVLTVDRPFLKVSNHGIPIPEADLQHIFEPFFRSHEAAAVEGHGLGLALSRTILERHGILFDVRSADNRTTFSLRFPRRRSPRLLRSRWR